MEGIFERTISLIGEDAFLKLQGASVAVFGVGGVGSYVCEGLVRGGIGSLTLIDHDEIAVSNINRQLPASVDTIGQKKCEVMKNRLTKINPDCRLLALDIFYNAETMGQIDLSRFDYVVDSIDSVSSKLLLIEECERLSVPIISSMGTANKLDPTRFQVSDIYKTSVCPLARVMRYELKKRGIKRLKCLWSDELPRKPLSAYEPIQGKRIVPASISFVPSVAGLIIAGEVIKDIAKIN